MRIILVNKFYFPQGGADKHVLQLERRLKERGHEVAIFAMDHPNNLPSPWSKYFVSRVDFSQVKFNWQGLRTAVRMFYSFEAARKMERLIRDFKPDVVHIHNIYHQISPSILPVIARHNVPIVQTLHDYALVSANYNLYAHDRICEHGQRGRFWEYVQHRCIKNSFAASLLAAVDRWWQARRKYYERYVGTFISPSSFLSDYVQERLIKSLNIKVLANFIDTTPERVWPKDGSIVYCGRLSSEKGIATLIRAAAHVDRLCYIVGTGPLEAELRKLADSYGLTNINWTGFLTGEHLRQVIGQASALVVPSEWYENCPLVVLEAMALGTPVIGSRIGGIPELVRDGENGWLFTAGRADELTAAINRLQDTALLEKLAAGALASAQQHTADKYVDSLLGIYAAARTR